MKQAKIMPCGRCSPAGLSAGVHRNTNVYMLPSNSDCIAPSSAIFGSASAQQILREPQVATWARTLLVLSRWGCHERRRIALCLI